MTGDAGGDPIDDPADPRLADYVALADPAASRRHEREDVFISEGPIALEKLVASGHPIRSVLTTPRHAPRVRTIVAGVDVPIHVATRAAMAATIGFDLHRGIVASATRRPGPTVRQLIDGVIAGAAGRSVRIAVLEGLNDPENLGLVARSARAFGIAGLLLDPTCIDPYYRRSVRVSMGEVLLLPIARSREWPADVDRLHDAGFETWALTPDPTAEPLPDVTPPARLAVLFGAEGSGLSALALDAARRAVRIPIDPAVDSINVGHAAAITFAMTTLRTPTR